MPEFILCRVPFTFPNAVITNFETLSQSKCIRVDCRRGRCMDCGWCWRTMEVVIIHYLWQRIQKGCWGNFEALSQSKCIRVGCRRGRCMDCGWCWRTMEVVIIHYLWQRIQKGCWGNYNWKGYTWSNHDWNGGVSGLLMSPNYHSLLQCSLSLTVHMNPGQLVAQGQINDSKANSDLVYGRAHVSVNISSLLFRGNFKRRVTHSAAPGNTPCRGNFFPYEQKAKVAPGHE